MGKALVSALVYSALIAFAYAAVAYSGPDQNGVKTVCDDSGCSNSAGHECSLITVGCNDWRCKKSPSRLLCFFTNSCIAAWCVNPHVEPSPAPSPPPPSKPWNMDHCEGARVRKSFQCLTKEERKNYYNVFTQLSEAGALSALVQSYDTNVWEATGGPKWLPWARTYLRRFENLGREVVEDFSLPYWDFESVANNFAMSSIWKMKPGMAKSIKGRCLRNKPWQGFYVQYPKRHCPIRGFNSNKKNQVAKIDGVTAMSRLVSEVTRYEEFADIAEYSWHRIRMALGGEMATRTAPNDPLYLLLIASFDRYWSIWQEEHGYDKFGGDHRGVDAETSSELLAFGTKIEDVMEVKCVSYEDPCAEGEDPEDTPPVLSDEYMEANELLIDEMRKIEENAENVLYAEDDEPMPSAEEE